MINLDAFKPSSIAPTEMGACGRGWVGQKGRCRRAVPGKGGKGMAGSKLDDRLKKKSAVDAEKVRESRGMKPREAVNAERKAAIESLKEHAAELKKNVGKKPRAKKAAAPKPDQPKSLKTKKVSTSKKRVAEIESLLED